jgi:hypothetical protein
MRLLLIATVVACMFVAGFLAAERLNNDDARAQTTWQTHTEPNIPDAREFVESLSSECEVDWEDFGSQFAIAYTCPD